MFLMCLFAVCNCAVHKKCHDKILGQCPGTAKDSRETQVCFVIILLLLSCLFYPVSALALLDRRQERHLTNKNPHFSNPQRFHFENSLGNNYCPSVLCHCWLGHLTRKNRPH